LEVVVFEDGADGGDGVGWGAREAFKHAVLDGEAEGGGLGGAGGGLEGQGDGVCAGERKMWLTLRSPAAVWPSPKDHWRAG